MQQTFYFRGSIFEYWKFILAQWQETPVSPLKIPANYVPKVNETISFAFYDEKGLEIIAVFADAAIGKNLVTLTVLYSDEAFEERGRPAVAMWDKLRKMMERKGLLIDPNEQYQDKKERGMYRDDDTRKKLELLRTNRREYIDEHEEAPVMYKALGVAKISRYLFKKYASDLFKNWRVIDYE